MIARGHWGVAILLGATIHLIAALLIWNWRDTDQGSGAAATAAAAPLQITIAAHSPTTAEKNQPEPVEQPNLAPNVRKPQPLEPTPNSQVLAKAAAKPIPSTASHQRPVQRKIPQPARKTKPKLAANTELTQQPNKAPQKQPDQAQLNVSKQPAVVKQAAKPKPALTPKPKSQPASKQLAAQSQQSSVRLVAKQSATKVSAPTLAPQKADSQAANPALAQSVNSVSAPAKAALKSVTASYALQLRQWIEKHKIYPPLARQRRIQGTGMLQITINRNGKVLSAQLVKKTGYRILDKTLKQLPKRASPFPAMPTQLTAATMTFSVPVRFGL